MAVGQSTRCIAHVKLFCSLHRPTRSVAFLRVCILKRALVRIHLRCTTRCHSICTGTRTRTVSVTGTYLACMHACTHATMPPCLLCMCWLDRVCLTPCESTKHPPHLRFLSAPSLYSSYRLAPAACPLSPVRTHPTNTHTYPMPVHISLNPSRGSFLLPLPPKPFPSLFLLTSSHLHTFHFCSHLLISSL